MLLIACINVAVFAGALGTRRRELSVRRRWARPGALDSSVCHEGLVIVSEGICCSG